MSQTQEQLLGPLLKAVSRSFYLTLRVLPAKIRPQIGLAYLLARTTDTIADTELVPLELRLSSLRDLRERIAGRSEKRLDLGKITDAQSLPAERTLLQQCEASLALMGMLSPDDRKRLLEVLEIITSGQELDLRRFAGASKENVIALQKEEELDDYTYRVAGCVGEFWTRMCRAHLFPGAKVDDAFLLTNGVRFGKGLQLVNILRDLPADLRQGRCYLPEEKLNALGLKPADLLRPASEPRMRPLYDKYLDRAQEYLQAGWAYTLALPGGCMRVRLGCALPILIGWETLKLLRRGKILEPVPRIKLSRQEVRRLRMRVLLLYPWRKAWSKMVPLPAPGSS